MESLPYVLYLTVLLDIALGSLPAPVNLSVRSYNFRHVLRWDPGQGTPDGTTYIIDRRVSGRNKTHSVKSKTTSFTLRLPPKDRDKEFRLTVQASYNNTLSEKSKVSFTPLTDTVIGPPKVSLSGCGNCIHVNISLPEADPRSGIKDIKSVYHGAKFRVFWKKRNEAECVRTLHLLLQLTMIISASKVPLPQSFHSINQWGRPPPLHSLLSQSAVTNSKTYTVKNLQIGTEYCVRVNTEININRNTNISAWECTFTGSEKPSRGPVFSVAVAALVIVSGVVMISMFFLYYTGFLCKLTTTLPRALIKSLSQGYTLTPERTYPDKIYICAEMEKQRNNNSPSAPQAASRCTNSDEEDEEEEGGNIYMDRDAELSSDESSCQDSADVSRNSKGPVLGGSGSLKVQDTEFEVEVRHWDLDQNQGKAERTEVSFLPEGPVRVKLKEDEEEEDEDVVCESFGDINLFSVRLGALAACEDGEEEEEQNTSDCLSDILFDREPLTPTNSERPLSHTHSQRETTSINATYTRRLKDEERISVGK